MARPQRNNVDYFPFFCDDGNKMFYLEETYGNDGFAVFLKLLRELAKTDYHYLDLSKKPKIMFLSAKCKVESNTLISIVNDLVELEKFDSELWNDNKIIWCQDFIDSIQDAYSKRSNKCIDRNSLLLLLQSKGVRKPSKSTLKPSLSKLKGGLNPQSKVKYSKVKYSKEEENIVNDIDFLISLYPDFCDGRKCSTRKGGDSIKEKLKKILSKKTKEDIEASIKSYVSDCKNSKTYLLNFSKFLDELPEPTKSIDKNSLDDNYIYFQWNKDPSTYARRILKTESEKVFQQQLQGGYNPIILKSIKNKKQTWK
jgi:hypothetical protein